MATTKDRRTQEILDLGNHLFSKRMPKDALDQEIAWQFAPDLAEFNKTIEFGEDWAADRMDSFPEMVSRELSNQLGANLRPEGQPWFKQSTGDDELDADEATAQFLEYLTRVMRRELYRPNTGFVNATAEADRFYVNFGQAVISVEEDPVARAHLYFRNHHIKDCVWLDNMLGNVDHMHRRTKMTARAMKRMFTEDKLHDSVVKAASKEPYREFEVRFVTMPTDEYEDFTSSSPDGTPAYSKRNGKRLPFTLCVIDVENSHKVKDGGLVAFNYVVPRWARLSSTQYAFSPATMAGLADGRMAQMLSQILLESGEKAIDPPMIGRQDAMIGEPNLAAGGLSWVDIDHDVDLKNALDVIKLDPDMRVGFQMRVDLREMLSKAFFIDKLSLPEAGVKEMTAFETARRIEEHVRNLLPIFTPIQVEYNARLLDTAFEFLRNMRKVDFSRMPDTLTGADTIWQFMTPLQEARERILAEQFVETAKMLAIGAEAGASASPVHVDLALRDAVRGIGGPATWRKTQDEQMEEAEQNAEQATAMETVNQVGQGAAVAEQVGKAGQELGLIAPPGDAPPIAGGEGAPPSAPPSGGAPRGIPAPPGGGGGGAPDMMAMLQGMAGGGEAAQPQVMPPQGGADNAEMRRAIRMLSAQMAELNENLSKPRNITINRDKSGKVTGATAGGGKGGEARVQ